jgi:hypothetical protein
MGQFKVSVWRTDADSHFAMDTKSFERVVKKEDWEVNDVEGFFNDHVNDPWIIAMKEEKEGGNGRVFRRENIVMLNPNGETIEI